MNVIAFTPWKNVWVDYFIDYFKTIKDIKLDFNLTYQINLHKMYKYDAAVFMWCDSALVG